MLTLGIETSCDETSVAIMNDDGAVRCNLIASQIARHQPFGGVVPEIASREHLRHLEPMIREALHEAGVTLQDLGLIAVTNSPGLIGALLVGVAAAQGLAYGLSLPLIAVNHLEGHLFSPYLKETGPSLPLPARYFGLVVSGGHSSVYDVRTQSLQISMLNRTRDDAAGEIFDKVAKAIGLPYPGGPEIDRLAEAGNPDRFRFPNPRFKDESADFSFSGLKSNALRLARTEGVSADSEPELLADFAASFQRAIVDQLLSRLDTLWKSGRRGEDPEEVALSGGVAANSEVRRRLTSWCAGHGMRARLAERIYCTDNAAMIAFAGLQRFRAGQVSDAMRVVADSRGQIGIQG